MKQWELPVREETFLEMGDPQGPVVIVDMVSHWAKSDLWAGSLGHLEGEEECLPGSPCLFPIHSDPLVAPAMMSPMASASQESAQWMGSCMWLEGMTDPATWLRWNTTIPSLTNGRCCRPTWVRGGAMQVSVLPPVLPSPLPHPCTHGAEFA